MSKNLHNKIDQTIQDDGSCGGFKHCFLAEQTFNEHDRECKKCMEDIYDALHSIACLLHNIFHQH